MGAASATINEADAAAWQSPVNPWIIALTVTLATFMEVLDTSIANVASTFREPILKIFFSALYLFIFYFFLVCW